MAGSSAIRDLDETLITLLRDSMRNDLAPYNPEQSIVLISPGEVVSGDVRLSLFLYQTSENGYLKNLEMQKIDSSRLVYPPLVLDVMYILTAYPVQGNDPSLSQTAMTMEAHKLLGRAIQVFHDNSVLSGTVLKGSLAINNDELHLTLNPLNLDEMTKVWSTFQGKVWRPSVCYLVTPLMIESTTMMSTQRVVSKEIDYYYSIPKKEDT